MPVGNKSPKRASVAALPQNVKIGELIALSALLPFLGFLAWAISQGPGVSPMFTKLGLVISAFILVWAFFFEHWTDETEAAVKSVVIAQPRKRASAHTKKKFRDSKAWKAATLARNESQRAWAKAAMMISALGTAFFTALQVFTG